MHGHQLVLTHQRTESYADHTLAVVDPSAADRSSEATRHIDVQGLVQRSSSSDAELVARCLHGDEAAWSLLIDRYKRLVYSIPFKYGLSFDDACDIFQSVCVDLVSELGKLRKPEAVKSWLMSVATHKALKLKRGRRQVDGFPSSDTMADVVPDDSPTAASVLEATQREQAVRDAVASLPDRCQELVRLLFFTEPPLPYAQVAARLGLAVGSIGFIRGRCLKKLDAALKARGI